MAGKGAEQEIPSVVLKEVPPESSRLIAEDWISVNFHHFVVDKLTTIMLMF